VGEIKSTLELVMEKTKQLTLSKEEREKQKHKEIKIKLNGLLQKYLDKELKKEQLKKELNSLQESYEPAENSFLIHEILGRLSLDKDNSPLLDLLREFFSLDVMRIAFLLNDYLDTVTSATQNRTKEVKEYLSKKHCISGSAVVPNLEADDAWLADVQNIKHKFNQLLCREKDRLTGK